ncbi:PRC-barrel domain containing protein [Candidatus Uhrbacteria bacterium]|nr:PRC-barrel domain containing protein [Candidatus Uhrbacteria bacterium]
MIVHTKDMLGVAVETRSGQILGKVSDFQLDSLTGHLVMLEVRPIGLVAGLIKESLLIPWNAIVEMTLEKVVVMDGAVKDTKTVPASVGPVVSPTLMKE